jgi:hypothetical protein
LVAIKFIREHKGCAVQGLGERKGHRGDESRPLSKRGGARKKVTTDEMNRLTANTVCGQTHPDAALARSCGALDATVQRWQRYSSETVIEEAEDPGDFEEVEE